MLLHLPHDKRIPSSLQLLSTQSSSCSGRMSCWNTSNRCHPGQPQATSTVGRALRLGFGQPPASVPTQTTQQATTA